jgi:hypothetical protein
MKLESAVVLTGLLGLALLSLVVLDIEAARGEADGSRSRRRHSNSLRRKAAKARVQGRRNSINFEHFS